MKGNRPDDSTCIRRDKVVYTRRAYLTIRRSPSFPPYSSSSSSSARSHFATVAPIRNLPFPLFPLSSSVPPPSHSLLRLPPFERAKAFFVFFVSSFSLPGRSIGLGRKMFEARGFVDLGGDGSSGLALGDPKLWLSGDANPPSPTHLPPHSSAAAAANVDRVLFNDLVEIVPLVQSLIVPSLSLALPLFLELLGTGSVSIYEFERFLGSCLFFRSSGGCIFRFLD